MKIMNRHERIIAATPERIAALIDATHPYAATIAANAARAADRAGVRFLALRRPPWVALDGDRWKEVADVAEAVRALEMKPRRVFVPVPMRIDASRCVCPVPNGGSA